MTERSEMKHRIAETQQKLMAQVANRAFSTKTTGLDGMAKSMLAKQARPVEHDPDLDHDDP